jgi:hypothetical protein
MTRRKPKTDAAEEIYEGVDAAMAGKVKTTVTVRGLKDSRQAGKDGAK